RFWAAFNAPPSRARYSSFLYFMDKLSRLRPAGCRSDRISDLSPFGVSHWFLVLPSSKLAGRLRAVRRRHLHQFAVAGRDLLPHGDARLIAGQRKTADLLGDVDRAAVAVVLLHPQRHGPDLLLLGHPRFMACSQSGRTTDLAALTACA